MSSFGPIVEGHLTLFSHPTPSEAAKPPKLIPFRVPEPLDLDGSRSFGGR